MWWRSRSRSRRPATLALVVVPPVRGGKQVCQPEIETREQRAIVDAVRANDLFRRLTGLPGVDRQHAAKTIDDPVLNNSGVEIFIALLDVVAPPGGFADGNEFDNNRRNIRFRIRSDAAVLIFIIPDLSRRAA